MYKFKIESLSCMSCYHNIEDAFKEFDSSIEAEADVRSRTLSVRSTHSVEKLTELLEEAGYPVSEILKG